MINIHLNMLKTLILFCYVLLCKMFATQACQVFDGLLIYLTVTSFMLISYDKLQY